MRFKSVNMAVGRNDFLVKKNDNYVVEPQYRLEEELYDLDLTMFDVEEDCKINLKYFNYCEKVNDIEHITRRNRAKQDN